MKNMPHEEWLALLRRCLLECPLQMPPPYVKPVRVDTWLRPLGQSKVVLDSHAPGGFRLIGDASS